MVHQINMFLLLFGALQGWLLSLWFFRNQRKESSYLFIALLLFVVGLQLTSKVISKVWLMDNAFVFYNLSYKLPYLIGPLLYLYSKAKKGNSIKSLNLLHFIPFFIAVSLGFNLFGIGLYLHPYVNCIFQLFSLGIYSYLAFKLSDNQVQTFLLVVAAAEVIIIITLAFIFMYYGRFPDVRILFIVLTALIYWITYRIISGSEQFKPVIPIVSLNFKRSPKYAHSSLKVEEADRIEQLLNHVMNHEMVYLNPSLTIDSLSLKLSTTRHNLSQVLNERLQKTYTDYINEFRLEESRKRLGDPANFRFTIAAIALDSGFNSVSSFNDVFKKKYGTTPSKFRDLHLNKMSA